MGWLSIVATATKSFFFGNRKAGEGDTFAQEAAKGIGNWVDERNFTEEEKSKANQKTLETVLEVYRIDAVGASTRSQARRELMWLFTRTYVVLMLGAGVMYKLDSDWAAFLLKIANDTYIGEITLAASTFYFLANALRK